MLLQGVCTLVFAIITRESPDKNLIKFCTGLATFSWNMFQAQFELPPCFKGRGGILTEVYDPLSFLLFFMQPVHPCLLIPYYNPSRSSCFHGDKQECTPKPVNQSYFTFLTHKNVLDI